MENDNRAVAIDADDLTSTFAEIAREAIKQAQQVPRMTVTITIDQTISPALINANYHHDVDTKAAKDNTSKLASSGVEIRPLGEQNKPRVRFEDVINGWLATTK